MLYIKGLNIECCLCSALGCHMLVVIKDSTMRLALSFKAWQRSSMQSAALAVLSWSLTERLNLSWPASAASASETGCSAGSFSHHIVLTLLQWYLAMEWGLLEMVSFWHRTIVIKMN